MAVKDAMPRLDADTIEELLAVPQSHDEVGLIEGFLDSQVNSKRQDAACATIRLPYRHELPTGWAVLFYEAEQTE